MDMVINEEKALWIRRTRNYLIQTKIILSSEGYFGLEAQAQELINHLSDIINNSTPEEECIRDDKEWIRKREEALEQDEKLYGDIDYWEE